MSRPERGMAPRLPATFWALFASRLVTRMGSFVVPFLSIYLTTVRHVGLPRVGLVLVAFGIGALAAPVTGGVLADRIGRKAVLVASLLGAALLLAPVYVAHATVPLCVAVLCYGFVLGLGKPAQTAMVADVVRPDARRRAYAVLFWATNLGFAVAMAAAGLLATHGYLLLFAGDATSCVLGAAVVIVGTHDTRQAGVRPRDQPGAEIERSTVTGAERSGLATALRDPFLVVLVVLGVAYATLYQQASVTLPLAMIRAGLSPAAYGVDIALNGLLIVILQPLFSRVLARYARMRLLAGSTAVVGVGFALSALAHSTLGYAGSVAVWSIGEIGTAGILSSVVADIAPLALRGRYAGVQASSWGIARLAAPLFGVGLLDSVGAHWLFVGCGVDGLAVAVGYLFLSVPLRRRLRSQESQAAMRATATNSGHS